MRTGFFGTLFLSVFSLAACETHQDTLDRLDAEIASLERQESQRQARELERGLSIARIEDIPIVIDYVGPRTPNSAGGIIFNLYFLNASNATIKYIDMTVRAYNAVGDPQGGEINPSSTRRVQFTGPTPPNRYAQASWGPLWYNSTIICTVITTMSITYMNGKRESFGGSSISELMQPYKSYGSLDQRTENNCNI